MAKSAKPPKVKGASGGGRSLAWLSGLVCGGFAVLAPGVAVTAVCLLAPGLAALKLDKEQGRPVARTVLTCGLAGCVHPVLMLWTMGQSLDTALTIATDPRILGRAWAAAAAGWLMTQIAPLLVRSALEAEALAKTARLRMMRDQIMQIWDLDDPGGGS